jgi:ubiquinone/menaquinone biosynthesis C-methylase UbiE
MKTYPREQNNLATHKTYRAIAEYYDAENVGRPMLEQDVPFFMGQLPRGRRQSILELAVGTARAAIPLAQAGHRVVGVDYDADMLAIARRKRDMLGIRERDLSLLKADALKLDLGRRFDWICIFFNTFLAFTTLEQQDALLQTIRRHLKPGGRAWIDIFNPDLHLLGVERHASLDPIAFHVPQYDRTVMRTVDVRRGDGLQVQRVTFRYRWFDASGRAHQERTEFDLTYIFPREMQVLLERNGLRLERSWGNYDGSAVTMNSPRFISRCVAARGGKP